VIACLCRSLFALVAALLPVTVLHAALTTPSQPPPETPSHNSLAGQLLVASPAMGDPRFARTVILMVRHDLKGAMGIIINRPFAARPLAGLLEAFGEPSPEATGEVRLFVGGPVQPELAFMLHTPDYRQPDTLDIGGRLALTTSRAVLRDLATGSGPSKSLLAFGYAGWGPSQLEGELAHKAWFTAPADLALIFDEDRATVWERAMARRTRDL
jgi:putative transcriptional regulator